MRSGSNDPHSELRVRNAGKRKTDGHASPDIALTALTSGTWRVARALRASKAHKSRGCVRERE